jgi:hypothetical protein
MVKVTITTGEIRVEADTGRDVVEVLNSLAARVLDIYAHKPHELVEHAADRQSSKREKKIDPPREPVGTASVEPARVAVPHVPEPAVEQSAPVRVVDIAAQQSATPIIAAAEAPRVEAAPTAGTPANGGALAALAEVKNLREVINYFVDHGAKDEDAVAAACLDIKDHLPYLATMANFEKRVRKAYQALAGATGDLA